MKVNDPNLAGLASTEAQRNQQAGQSTRLTGVQSPVEPNASQSSPQGSADDVHLSELVRSLRSLAAESPERQARLEQIARSYANGTYHVDTRATASKIVDDAFES
jgi:flagellar biosynthesis anti-sigma factor FlgM